MSNQESPLFEKGEIYEGHRGRLDGKLYELIFDGNNLEQKHGLIEEATLHRRVDIRHVKSLLCSVIEIHSQSLYDIVACYSIRELAKDFVNIHFHFNKILSDDISDVFIFETQLLKENDNYSLTFRFGIDAVEWNNPWTITEYTEVFF